MNRSDGRIIIGSKLDTSGFEQGLNKLIKDHLRDDVEIPAEINEMSTEEKLQKIKELAEQTGEEIGNFFESLEFETPEELQNFFDNLNVEDIPIAEKFEEMSAIIKSLNTDLSDLYQEYTELQKSPIKFGDSEAEAEELRAKMVEIINALEQITGKKIVLKGINDTKADLDDIKNKIDNVGKSTMKIVEKIGKWGLALFGIRSMYSFITGAVSTLSQYNDQLSADISYMRFAIASTLQKTIERLVELAYKLLQYINYISWAWFKVNLFANATTEAFQKQNKVMSGTVKQAKELQKTLAGFDEMNVLQENGSVTSGGGGGGVTTPTTLPSYDLSDLSQLQDVPEWLDKIAKNKDKVLKFLKIFAGIIAGIKIGSFVKSLFDLGKGLGIIGGSNGILAGVSLATIGEALLIIAGAAIGAYATYQSVSALVDAVKGLKSFMQIDEAETFVEQIKLLGDYASSSASAFEHLNKVAKLADIIKYLSPLNFLLKDISFTDMTNDLKNYYNVLADKTAAVTAYYAIKDVKEAMEDLKNAQDEYVKATDNYENAVDKQKSAQERLNEAQKYTKETGEELYNLIQKSPQEYQNLTDKQKETYKAYKDLIKANEDLKIKEEDLTTANKNVEDSTYRQMISTAKSKKGVEESSKAWWDFRNKIITAWESGQLSSEEAAKYIDIAMQNMNGTAKTVFGSTIPKEIKDAFKVPKEVQELEDAIAGTSIKMSDSTKTMSEGLKKGLNAVVSGINKMIKGLNKSKVWKLWRDDPYPELTPLRKGGIVINRPGQGVPISAGAKGGEVSREGVIPLTDSQQMEYLGEAIGRYITVNLTNITKMNGREINRELKRLSNQDDFAFNR